MYFIDPPVKTASKISGINAQNDFPYGVQTLAATQSLFNCVKLC
jgi:hypothetical protein